MYKYACNIFISYFKSQCLTENYNVTLSKLLELHRKGIQEYKLKKGKL